MNIVTKMLNLINLRESSYLINLLAVTKSVLPPFILHSLLVFTAVVWSDVLPPLTPAGFLNPGLVTSPFIEKLIRWDAHWYTYIAENGYNSQNIVFFPLLVLLIKAVNLLGLDYGTAGFVIANISTAISFYVLYLVFQLDYPPRQTQRALVAYAVMPMSFFLNSIYTEPLFLVFALTAIYFARTHKWQLAAVFGLFTALTRNLGICLVVLLIIEHLETANRRWLAPRPLLSLAVPALGLLGFMSYNYFLTGNALAFVHAQQGWGRKFALPWDNIWRNFELIIATSPATDIGIIMDSCLVLLALTSLTCLSLGTKFKIRRSYLVLGWLWLLIPLCSTSPIFPLYSMSRFVLVIFPLYIFLAQVKSVLFYTYFAAAMALLAVCTALFVNWYWLG